MCVYVCVCEREREGIRVVASDESEKNVDDDDWVVMGWCWSDARLWVVMHGDGWLLVDGGRRMRVMMVDVGRRERMRV